MMGKTAEGPDANVHVYVEYVEATFSRAKKADGSIVQELERKGDADYRGGVNDGNGVILWLSQQGDT